VSEVRQRWRLIFAREEEARYLAHLDAVRLWERAFRRGEIPVATSEGFSPRPKLVFAAPLQLGMLAEHELADLYLAERLTAPELRGRLTAGMPRGYRIVDLHDVWIGAPAIAPQLAAADYRLTLLHVESDRLRAAVEQLMTAEELPRLRRKEAREIPYDLRPLVIDLRATLADTAALPPGADPNEAAGLWMRLRHSQDRGSGRAEEVVGAIADQIGLAIRSVGSDADGGEAAATTGVGQESEAPSASASSTDSSSATQDLAAISEGGLQAPKSGESASARPPLEVLRPVRERLWLATELPDLLPAPPDGPPA
jgi:radical SAM-linked protein